MAVNEQKPIDGYGGELYQQTFSVPVYDSTITTFSDLSWQDIDLFYEGNASAAILNAVAFTICLMSFIYVVALTPQSKRRLRIHTYLLLALVFKMIDRSIALSLLLHSPDVSAYINLSLDINAVDISSGFKAKVTTLQIGTILTFACLQICLYTHGKPFLLPIRLYRKAVYYILLAYLLFTGVLAITLRITLTIMITLNLSQPLGPTGTAYRSVYQATIISFAVAIGSWSLVFFCTSVRIIIQRRRHFRARNKLYESVLHMIAFIGLESFIVPLAIAVLQLVPRINSILSDSPEVLLVPSVLLVLPLASIFGSTRAGSLSATTSELDRNANESQCSKTPILRAINADTCPCSSSNSTARSDTHRNKIYTSHPLDMELRQIDQMVVR